VQEEWGKNGEQERTKNELSRGKHRIRQEGKMDIKKSRETIGGTTGVRNLKKSDWKAIWKAVRKRRGGGGV
jgi:hypothetical protein